MVAFLPYVKQQKIKSVTYVVLQFRALRALKGNPPFEGFLTIDKKCYLCCAIRQLGIRDQV